MASSWRFRVRLLDVNADLWRGFLLKKTATFFDLHVAIQHACDWENCHLFSFVDHDRDSTVAGFPGDFGRDEDEPDAAVVKLSDYFPQETKVFYWYDFGDSWMHEVTLEGEDTPRKGGVRQLLDGAGVFPPEDCGGAPGYERCVAAATGRGWLEEFGDEREREQLVEWLGGWHPGSFDLEAAQKRFNR